MKPEIISMAQMGIHNTDLEASRTRVLMGATWKKQRVIVLLPSAATMSTKVALSHWNLIFPPNQAVYRMLCLGMEVGDAYSTAIEQILAHPELSQWEYVLTIESDNAPPQDGLLKLIADMDKHPEFACIGGLYWTKGVTGVPQIWGDPKDPVQNYRPQPPLPGQIVECMGTGMGFNLWRIAMFADKRIPRPLFRTKASATEGVGTQDLAFWGEARKCGYRCAVDCSVLVGHYDLQNDIMY